MFSSEKFEAQLKRAGLNMTQISDAVGVTRSAVSHWVSGKSTPNKKTFPKIAEALGCNIEDFQDKEDDITNQMRAVLRDDDGRIKHETRFDSQGNIYREHWNLELSPALWKRMKACMKKRGLVGNEVDGYLQELICEDYRKNILVQTPENQMTEEKSEAN